jgi:ATP-dependent helicase/nuclease subunit B
LPEDITIHLLKQPQDEVSFVVEKILSLRRKGYRYRDIAVVTGDMEVYGALAKGQFARAQIPCFIDQKKSILAHPFVSMIETLFEVLYTDFAYEPVMKYLKGRYSPLTREQADLVDNYLLATGLRGHKKWMDVWESTRAFPIREEAEKERLTEALNQARELAWNTFRLPEETLGRRKHTVKEFATVFVSFLEQENFYHRLQKDVSDFRDSNKLEQAKEYEQIYGIVLGVLDRMVELLGQEEMSLKSFRELLNTGFSEARVGLIPPQVDQVMVGDLTRTRLHHIKHLFFLGMTDANIPKGAGGGGILSSPERSFLEEQDFELAPTEREKVYTEQFYLYLTLTKPEHHLYLCLCESGNDGKAQNPSYLVDRICQLFPEMKINAEEQNRQEEHILGTDRGFSYLIKGLQNKNYQDKQWKEIYGYYLGQEKYREQIDPVLEAAFYKSPEAKLTREAAKLLYQDILRGSASKFELYASCGYRYFLQYGLQLKERQERAVEFYDIGNIIHRSLELYTKDLIHREKNWQDISEDEQKTKAAEYFHQVITEYKDGILEESFRNRHMISLLQRILHRTIGTITEQMRQGEFRTVGSELRFEQVYGPLLLTGSVDRIDRLETEDTDYISIVDYKTGTKNISLSDLYYGLQMQLVIYLQAAISETKKERDRENIRKKVIPAGIFYYHPEDPMLKEYVEEAGRQKEILKQLRLKGLFNEESEVMYGIDRHLVPASGSGLAGSVKSTVTAIDTKKDGSLTSYTKGAVTESEFDLLMHYTSDKLQEMSHSILEGEIPMKPYRKEDGQEACGFCPYHGVCQFDAKIDGQEYRLIAEKTSEDVMDELTKKYDS